MAVEPPPRIEHKLLAEFGYRHRKCESDNASDGGDAHYL